MGFAAFANSSNEILNPRTGIIYQHNNYPVVRFCQYQTQQAVH